jgi:hypothetical protein
VESHDIECTIPKLDLRGVEIPLQIDTPEEMLHPGCTSPMLEYENASMHNNGESISL